MLQAPCSGNEAKQPTLEASSNHVFVYLLIYDSTNHKYKPNIPFLIGWFKMEFLGESLKHQMQEKAVFTDYVQLFRDVHKLPLIAKFEKVDAFSSAGL